MTPKTTLLKRGSAHFHRPGDRTDLFPNHFNRRWRSAKPGEFLCAEGRRPALIWGCEGYRKFNLVLSVTVARGDQSPGRSLVICLLPGVLSLPPPPLRLTLSHTHHLASPLKWDTSPRQQRGWRHWPWGECERLGGGAAQKGRESWGNSCEVRAMNRKEDRGQKKNRQTSLRHPCHWRGCVCLWIYSCLFVHPFLGEFLWPVIRLCPAGGEGWRGGGAALSPAPVSPATGTKKTGRTSSLCRRKCPGYVRIIRSGVLANSQKKTTRRRL